MLCAATTPQQREDQMWIHWSKSYLAASVLDEWEQYRNRENVGGLPTLDQFKQFLHYKSRVHKRSIKIKVVQRPTNEKERRNISESATKSGNSGNRGKPYDKRKSTSTNAQSDSFGFGPAPACIMTGCNSIHYLGQCESFKQLKLADRLEIVKAHQLCRCCLMAGHMAAVCKRRGCSNCRDSKVKHHYHLCTKNAASGSAKKDPTKAAQTAQ